MATLPQVTSPRPVPRPSRPMAGIASAGAVGNAMQSVGQQINLAGMQILDREATAAAKDADTAAADRIRALLYDPETGFANLRGADAVASRERVSVELDRIMETSLANLSGAARRKAEDSLRGRVERGKMTIDTHTSDQRAAWIDGARTARIESSYQDILVNLGVTNDEMLRIEGEVRGRAADMGWSSEQTELEVTKARSTVHMGVAERIAMVDPEGAAAYLQEHRDSMLGSDVVALEAKLIPLAKDAEGRRLGAAAAGGLPAYTYSTQIDYAMGPARPNKPQQPIIDVIGKSAEDVFGKGARVVVTSGEEDEGHRHGSNRHGTGLAADIQIIRPDGSVVKATDADMALFATAAAKNGALGLGFGAEYMGGNHIHVDLVTPGEGQAHVWASGAKAMEVQLQAEMSERSGMTMDDILNISDPRVRAAAMDEANLRLGLKAAEAKAVTANAANAAFALIEGGGSLSTLTVDQRVAIGEEGMSSLRTYEAKVNAKDPVDTDVARYAALRVQAVTDPAKFRAAAAAGFVADADKLSPADRKALVDMGTKPVDPEGQQSAASLMSVATAQLRAVGVQSGDPVEAQVQSQLLNWQEQYRISYGKFPTQLETDQQVGAVLNNMVIAAPAPKGDALSAATLRSISENRLRESGVKSDDPGMADLQDNLLAWQEGFAAMNGRYPTDLDVNQRTKFLTTPVFVNGSGLRNYRDGNVMNAGKSTVADIVAAEGITIGGKEVPPGTAAQVEAEMIKRGVPVTPESLMETLAMFAASLP